MKNLSLCFVCFLTLLSVPCSSSAVDIANCSIVCSMDTSKFRINNPYPGINVRLADLWVRGPRSRTP